MNLTLLAHEAAQPHVHTSSGTSINETALLTVAAGLGLLLSLLVVRRERKATRGR